VCLLEAERIKVIKVTKQNKHRAQKGSKIPKGHSEAVSRKRTVRFEGDKKVIRRFKSKNDRL
jgi:hypothetical protein